MRKQKVNRFTAKELYEQGNFFGRRGMIWGIAALCWFISMFIVVGTFRFLTFNQRMLIVAILFLLCFGGLFTISKASDLRWLAVRNYGTNDEEHF